MGNLSSVNNCYTLDVYNEKLKRIGQKLYSYHCLNQDGVFSPACLSHLFVLHVYFVLVVIVILCCSEVQPRHASQLNK